MKKSRISHWSERDENAKWLRDCLWLKRANVVLHVGLCKEIFARKHTATHKPTSAEPPIVTTITHTHTHTHTHTQTHTHTHTHTHTYTHTQQIGVGVFHAWLFRDRADGWVSEVFHSTDARRACRRGAIGSTMGRVSQRYRFESRRGQWALFSLIPSALSFVFLWHTHTHTPIKHLWAPWPTA